MRDKPVFAMPIKSLPDIIAGTAWAWIGVGLSKPSFFNMFSSLVDTPHWAHVFIGFGHPLPADNKFCTAKYAGCYKISVKT